MEAPEFRIQGKEVVDYLADYLENIRDRKVYTNPKPGFLQKLLPQDAPVDGEDWKKIFQDFDELIMPNILHWQSPHNHGYYPTTTSFTSMVAEMVADGINSIGFSYASSPAGTELEMSVMNWLGRMIGLPEDFMHKKHGRGGGVIHATVGDGTLVSLLAARNQIMEKYRKTDKDVDVAKIWDKLVAYGSDQCNIGVEKGARIALVNLRYVESDKNLSMRGALLREMIKKDKEDGLIPFWVCATLGTFSCCSFDSLAEIGQICEDNNLWLHVDANYAGNAFICPEFRGWMQGIDKVDSFGMDVSKWLMINPDCTATWIKNSNAVIRAMTVDQLYLHHDYSGVAVDFMHWQVSLSRKTRSIKLWFVIRKYGVLGLQKHIRQTIHLAEEFEALVRSDPRFEIPFPRHLSLVVFALVAGNTATATLWERINHRGKIHCISATINEKYVIRFVITSPFTTMDDIVEDWNEIKTAATEVLKEFKKPKPKVLFVDSKFKHVTWDTSSLLSHPPTSPKIMGGSFLALYDGGEEWYQSIKEEIEDLDDKEIKEILMADKQFSLNFFLDVLPEDEADQMQRCEDQDVDDGLCEKCRQAGHM